jgi:hypothetical protein
MKKLMFMALLGICFVIFPVYVYSAGIRDVSLTIENRTGTHITQILISEVKSSGEQELKPHIFNRSIENNESTVIKLKRRTMYAIVLINTEEREFAPKGQAWDEKTAIISFRLKDIQDRNIWDKAKRVILWPKYL